MWNILKTIKKGDYDYALIPDHPKATKNGYVLMHRAVVENSIGRILKESEEVHHINKNTHDNSIENLMVVTSDEHRKIHSSEKLRKFAKLVCPNCIKKFERPENQLAIHKGGKLNFCSPKCRGAYTRATQLGRLTDEQKNAAMNNVEEIFYKNS